MDSPGPTTELCAPAEPILVTARATPLATNRVRAIVAISNIVRLILYPSSVCVCDGRQRDMGASGRRRRTHADHDPFLPHLGRYAVAGCTTGSPGPLGCPSSIGRG